MTARNFSTAGVGLARRNMSNAVPFILAARKPNRPLPTLSLRVPVTSANRSYLRELRHAEMRAWQNRRACHRPTSSSDVVSSLQREQRDLYTFGFIVALTMTLAGIVLAQSPHVTQQCAHWLNLVRQFLG